MCNNNGSCGCLGNNWLWIILLLLLFCGCGNTGCSGNSCGNSSDCGCC